MVKALCDRGDLNPFQMLPDAVEVSGISVYPVDDLDENRPHRVLVRSLWHQLQAALPENFESLSSVDLPLRCRMSREDLLLIKQFVERNPLSSSYTPSADGVNEIFSRFIEAETQDSGGYFNTDSLYHSWLIPLFIISCIIYLKFGPLFLFIMVILSFSSYELYYASIAKRHDLLTRLPTVPQHCLPYSQQSFTTKVFSYLPFIGPKDDCAHYYQTLMTSPFMELRPDRIVLAVLSEYVEYLFSTAGGSIGRFYARANQWIPFYVLFPLMLVFPPLFLKCVSFKPPTRRRRRQVDREKEQHCLNN